MAEKLTKKQVREITKNNYLTNPIAKAILICARSRAALYSQFLADGALITFRRRFLHNELSDNDKQIVELVEWAIEENGLPAEGNLIGAVN